MLLLALTCARACLSEKPLIDKIQQGQIIEALKLSLDRLERPLVEDESQESRATLGQIVSKLLLATGREEEAEDFFRKQLRAYEAVSRTYVRWMSSLDQGTMCLSLNKLGRACEAFNMVADDVSAPAHLRIDALAGLTVALLNFGEYRRAHRALTHAEELAKEHQFHEQSEILELLRLELSTLRHLRAFDEGDEFKPPEFFMETQDLHHRIHQAKIRVGNNYLLGQRLHFLHTLTHPKVSNPETAAHLFEGLRWLKDNRLQGWERAARVEAALAFVNHSDSRDAQEVLGSLAHDEVQIHRNRNALELKFCLSKIHALHGRHVDALRVYKEHASLAMARIRTELSQLPYSRFMEKQEMAEHNDSTKLSLPLRYRKAYQFIIEHLDDRDLSIRQVAAYIDVTERALQMAFRSHLGMTPAELIRRKRMDHIRNELRNSTQQESVLEVASHWGMTNRSTLAQNYRQQFGETPTSMLRGKNKNQQPHSEAS